MKMIGFQRRYVALTYLGFPLTSPTLGSCVPSFFTCWLRGSRSLKELSESTFTGDCTWPTSLPPVQVAFRWLLQICPSDLFSYIATRESFFFFFSFNSNTSYFKSSSGSHCWDTASSPELGFKLCTLPSAYPPTTTRLIKAHSAATSLASLYLLSFLPQGSGTCCSL